MKIRTLGIVAMLLGACGGGGGATNDAGPTPDATMTDGSAMGDGGSGFDPNMTYPGEGDPCEFSILCGDQQLCVDDQCIRHERLDPSTVQISDYRVLVSDTEHPTPLKTDAEIDWSSPDLLYYSYLFPGHDGPALVFFAYSERNVQIAVYDDHFRALSVAGMWVTALGYSPDGLVVAGGADNVTGRPRLVMFDHEDHVLFDELTPESLDTQVQADPVAPPGTAMLGVPQSFLWNGDHFEVAFALGDATTDQLSRGVPDLEFLTPRPPTHTILGEVMPTGDVNLKPLAGELLVPGARAWLVNDDRGEGLILAHGLSNTDGLAEVMTDWRSLGTGVPQEIVSDVGSGAMYYQPSPGTWYYLYESIDTMSGGPPLCTLRGYRNGTSISLMAYEQHSATGCASYEGISLSSQFGIFQRVYREQDPFLTSYMPEDIPLSSMPDVMHINRYSSDGAVDEVQAPFVASRDCILSGSDGFPVSRFNISFEVLVTSVNGCGDSSVSGVAIVEGHLVTGG